MRRRPRSGKVGPAFPDPCEAAYGNAGANSRSRGLIASRNLGTPSALILHGYAGFIFGSVKANPWWSSVLIPIVFLFSALVSGIAMILLLYYLSTLLRRKTPSMDRLNSLAAFLFYALILDFSLELLDFIHRLDPFEESIEILS